MSEWTAMPERAHFDARHEPRDPAHPPHWLRCEHYRDGKRCKLADGHGGDHQPAKEHP